MAMARDIMHAGADCVGQDESLLTAAQMMRDRGVGSLPICGNEDRLHGIITDRDIVVQCVAAGRDPGAVRAEECAQAKLYWVDAGADIGDVLAVMEEHHIRRVPVIAEHRLVGMISEHDLAQRLPQEQLAHFVTSVYAD